VIEGISPRVDDGRFPAKRVAGDDVVVEADIIADNHEEIAADLLFRRTGADWHRAPMEPAVNDRWQGSFACPDVGEYEFAIEAWVDHFGRWQRELGPRAEAGQDLSMDLLIGASMIDDAAARESGEIATVLKRVAGTLAGKQPAAKLLEVALDPGLASAMRESADRGPVTRSAALPLIAGPRQAGFSAWYEMFPRSASPDPGRSGTFRDVERLLPYVAQLGFDVLYLPPIHPIGTSHRKGANNAVTATTSDPGSPWAIGSALGGHTAVGPELGTLDEFRHFVRAATKLGIDIALDIAFQCSPDHPYVTEHPEWFKVRPDGSVQYAENPPKKYQDIYPFDFETPAWRSLWEELKSIFLFWMDQGVRIFRVDNPHTKPFAFWEWCLAELQAVDPEVILLSEAFTTPKIMYRLAKLGFSQSYTYFAWRTDKHGLTEYFSELTQPPVSDFFRPNAWPNTPDILTEELQQGGRPAFVSRVVLAATLSSNYGIYGPAFELMEHLPREQGSEEYSDSEKYQVRNWDRSSPDSLAELIALVNQARRENPALQRNHGLRFHHIDNGQLLAYSKQDATGENVIICIVNLDHSSTQSGWLWLPVGDWGIGPDEPYQVHDLLGGARYTWQGANNFVQLDPHVMPAHVFRLRRRTGGSGWEFE
jgi:starch synthase (maltosyl-transferring)